MRIIVDPIRISVFKKQISILRARAKQAGSWPVGNIHIEKGLLVCIGKKMCIRDRPYPVQCNLDDRTGFHYLTNVEKAKGEIDGFTADYNVRDT